MGSVAAVKFKNGFFEYMKRIRFGSTFTIFDNGKPVARVIPINADRPSIEETLTRLSHEGLLEGDISQTPLRKPHKNRTVLKGQIAADMIIDDR